MPLDMKSHSSHEEGGAQHKEEVGEDAPQERQLDQSEVPSEQCRETHNHLGEVAEGGIEQSSNGVIGM